MLARSTSGGTIGGSEADATMQITDSDYDYDTYYRAGQAKRSRGCTRMHTPRLRSLHMSITLCTTSLHTSNEYQF